MSEIILQKSTVKHNPPLLRLIAPRFAQVNVFSRVPIPPLGLLYVGSSVKAHTDWRVEIMDENNWKGELDHHKIQKENPADAVGFYAGMTSTIPRIYELAKMYKDMGVMTMSGGSHVDALPEDALHNDIDVVVRGEGEKSSVEILDAWFNGGSLESIKGIAFIDKNNRVKINEKREPVDNLDSLDLPDFNQIINLKHPMGWFPVSRTRGCNYSCEFCTVRDQQGRARSTKPERTFAEIVELVEKFRAKYFFITDDNFAQDRDGTVKLCNMIADYSHRKNKKLKFTIQLRAEAARDAELVDAMWRAGVQIICIGLESPIPEDLKMMHKGQTVENMEKDIAILRKAGFYIHGMFIFGYPSEEGTGSNLTTREKSDIYIDFIKRTGIDTIQILKAVPIPGSKLYERLRKAGKVYPLDKVGWDKYDGNFLCFEPSDDDPVQVQLEATRIMDVFYRPSFIWKAIGILPILPFDSIIHAIRLARSKSSAMVQSGKITAERHLSERREAASRRIEAGREVAIKRIEAGREAASKKIEAGKEAASKKIEAGKEVASRVIGHTVDRGISRISSLRREFRNSIYRYIGSRILSTWHRLEKLDVFLDMLRRSKKTKEIIMK